MEIELEKWVEDSEICVEPDKEQVKTIDDVEISLWKVPNG